MAKRRKTSCSSYHDSETNKKKDDEQNENPSMVVEVDRYVPELPGLVIHQILLYLTLLSPKLAARASLVSTEWASIWRSLTVLAFEEYDQDPKPYTDDKVRRKQKSFVKFVDTYLKRWKKDKQELDKLVLFRMKYSGSPGTIQRCLSFAVGRNVKEIHISFIREDIGRRSCKTFCLSPVLLNSAQSLTILVLENVNLRRDVTGAVISLPSLKTMSLKHLKSNLTYWQLLSGCPVLENLLLNSCDGFRGNLSSSSLKSLEVIRCNRTKLFNYCGIEAENLEYIKLDGDELYDTSSCEIVRRRLEFIGRLFSSQGFEGFNSESPLLLQSWTLNRCKWQYICNISNQHLQKFVSFGSGVFITCKLTIKFSKLLEATIVVPDWNSRNGIWSHCRLILVLGNFDRCRKLSLHFNKAEDLIFPAEMRSEYPPPLPTLKHLRVETSTTAVSDSVLMDSLRWMAPSSQLSIYNKHCVQ